MVSGTTESASTSLRKPIKYSGNSLGGIPVDGIPKDSWGVRTGTGTKDDPYKYDHTNCSLTYHYWYY
jgi:hypothetical protein